MQMQRGENTDRRQKQLLKGNECVCVCVCGREEVVERSSLGKRRISHVLCQEGRAREWWGHDEKDSRGRARRGRPPPDGWEWGEAARSSIGLRLRARRGQEPVGEERVRLCFRPETTEPPGKENIW